MFKKRLQKVLALLVGGYSMVGCWGEFKPSFEHDISYECNTGIPQIQVYDAMMKVLCGCSLEEREVCFNLEEPLTCHLSPGQNRVLFYFFGNYLPHQIFLLDDIAWPVMPLLKGMGLDTPVQVFSALFPKSSTSYQFIDGTTGMSGTFFLP